MTVSARRVFLAVALLIAWSGTVAPTAALAADPLIPAQVFFANDQVMDVELSPSGRHIALIAANKSGRRVLAVQDVEAGKPAIVVADSPDADVYGFWWVNDERLIYDIADLQAGAAEQRAGGLFSVKRDGSDPHAVSGRRGLLFVPRNGGDEVILGRYQYDGVRDLVAVHPEPRDLSGGANRAIATGYPSGSIDWVFDRAGEPRAVSALIEGMTEIFWHGPDDKGWRSLGKWPKLETPWHPHSVDAEGHFYVVVTPPGSTSHLARFDFATGQPEPAPIVSTPGFDFTGSLVYDDDGRRVVGVRVDTDAETTVWLDPEIKKFQALADARFPDRINRVDCRHCTTGGTVLVYSYSDRDPGVYSLYRPETSTWTTIGRRRSGIDPRQMATLDLHRIQARDGMDLPVWVTTPPGKASAPRPAVVLVHGGPWLRGTFWQWDAQAQFLASRGYVVIQPEYRGGTGFGKPHLVSGFRNWGTTMQDDVADAVQWAIGKGIVDGSKVCIAGGSYGGYATLMGAIRYPQLYRCGAAWVAVTDPRLMIDGLWVSDVGREGREYSYKAMIGDPDKDGALLRAASPVERAAELKVPILMAFGIQDRRVPLDHARRMRSAMRAAGQDPEVLFYDGEGHGWFKVENRIDFWTHVEKFLDKNLH